MDRHKGVHFASSLTAQAVALEERVDPEARPARHRVGEVELPLVLEALALVLREDRVEKLARVVTGPRDASLGLDDRGRVRRKYESRSLLAAYGAMLVEDLQSGDPVSLCAREACRTPFVYHDARARFCRKQCRWAQEQHVYRKALMKRGES